MKISQNTTNVNLALNKPTTQSSVYQPETYGYDPHGACNGRKDGEFGFHTHRENQPWWQIDLQGKYQLSEIKIYNRINVEERASTLNILLSHDALNWQLCYSNDQKNLFGGIYGKPLTVDLLKKVARFVRLQLRENEYLHLDEVEIYGIPLQSDSSELKSNQDEATLSANFYNGSQLTPHTMPHTMQSLIMNMLSRLRMYDTDMGKIRVGSLGDGGYVIPDDLADIKGVVSICIGGEVSFDLHFAKTGVKVFQYDHTIEAPPFIHDNFVFNKLGWSSQDDDGFITLSKILETNNLLDGDLILKFDVENAEWDALFNVPQDLLKRFRIITCELHDFHNLENISVFNKVNQVINLLTANHTVVHIHPNNCCGIALVAGIALPKLIEFSFLRNDRASFYPSHDSIPSNLDYPNVRSEPEIVLTPFHMSVNQNPDVNLAGNKLNDQSSIYQLDKRVMIPYTGSSPFLRVVSASQWNFFLIEPEPEKYDRKYCCFFGLGALVYLDKKVCLSDKFTHYTDALSLQIKKDIHNGKCLLILDLSNEGHIEPNNVYYINLLEDLIDNLKPADNSILFIDQNRRITKTFNLHEKFNKLRHKIKFLNYDYFHKLLINDVFISSHPKLSSDQFFPSFESFFDHKQKLLLSLIGTPRPHRIVLYYYLKNRSYKNNSLVSFVGFDTTKGKKTKEYSLNFLKVNPLGKYLDEQLNKEKIEKIINNLPSEHLDTDIIQDLNSLVTHIPFELYKQSFFSVVSETEFSNGDMNRITEKTLKSFAMGHPSIIVGNPNSLDLVKELGFQLFEDVINPRYDEIIDPLERFEAILDTIEETVACITIKPKVFAELIYEKSKYNFIHAVVGLKTKYEELMEYPILEYITEWLSKEN